MHTLFLKVFPWQRLRMIEELISSRDAILQREYDYHLRTYDRNRSRNITDVLLAMRNELNQNKIHSVNEGEITKDHVIMSMWEVFAGGFESTLQNLRWAISFLVNNPDVSMSRITLFKLSGFTLFRLHIQIDR